VRFLDGLVFISEGTNISPQSSGSFTGSHTHIALHLKSALPLTVVYKTWLQNISSLSAFLSVDSVPYLGVRIFGPPVWASCKFLTQKQELYSLELPLLWPACEIINGTPYLLSSKRHYSIGSQSII